MNILNLVRLEEGTTGHVAERNASDLYLANREERSMHRTLEQKHDVTSTGKMLLQVRINATRLTEGDFEDEEQEVSDHESD